MLFSKAREEFGIFVNPTHVRATAFLGNGANECVGHSADSQLGPQDHGSVTTK